MPDIPRVSLLVGLLGACVAAALVGVSPAAAQPADCEAPDPTTAEVNSREGVRVAKSGRFEDAIPLFRIAMRLDPCAPEHPLLLARALARIGDREEAKQQYRAVMNRFPNTPEAGRARAELEELEAAPPAPPPEEKKTDEPMPPTLEEKAPPPEGPPWRIIGYSTVGVGALLLAGGVYFALDAQSADDDLGSASEGQDRDRYDELVDQRDSSGTLAWVMYGAGGALLAGGLVMAFLLPPDEGGTAQLRVAPGALGLSGSF